MSREMTLAEFARGLAWIVALYILGILFIYVFGYLATPEGLRP